jgi:hypothetical protein
MTHRYGNRNEITILSQVLLGAAGFLWTFFGRGIGFSLRPVLRFRRAVSIGKLRVAPSLGFQRDWVFQN